MKRRKEYIKPLVFAIHVNGWQPLLSDSGGSGSGMNTDDPSIGGGGGGGGSDKDHPIEEGGAKGFTFFEDYEWEFGFDYDE